MMCGMFISQSASPNFLLVENCVIARYRFQSAAQLYIHANKGHSKIYNTLTAN
jgi:hypothetical protein